MTSTASTTAVNGVEIFGPRNGLQRNVIKASTIIMVINGLGLPACPQIRSGSQETAHYEPREDKARGCCWAILAHECGKSTMYGLRFGEIRSYLVTAAIIDPSRYLSSVCLDHDAWGDYYQAASSTRIATERWQSGRLRRS
jgi:hypothetical protein